MRDLSFFLSGNKLASLSPRWNAECTSKICIVLNLTDRAWTIHYWIAYFLWKNWSLVQRNKNRIYEWCVYNKIYQIYASGHFCLLIVDFLTIGSPTIFHFHLHRIFFEKYILQLLTILAILANLLFSLCPLLNKPPTHNFIYHHVWRYNSFTSLFSVLLMILRGEGNLCFLKPKEALFRLHMKIRYFKMLLK